MESELLPTHIGLILDGNRRWAKKHMLTTAVGHHTGIMRAKEIVLYAQDRGVKILTAWGFSTENWDRSKEEIDYLMKVFEEFIDKNIDEFHKRGIRLKHLGCPKRLPKSLQQKIAHAVELTKNNAGMIYQMAINYGGRDDIIRAIKKLIINKIKPDDVCEDLISNNLDTEGLPDPDLIIRTSGEQRTSGFLAWQCAYAELYFPKVDWPAFDEKEFDKAIDVYTSRQRRFGK